jgi:serine protease Do
VENIGHLRNQIALQKPGTRLTFSILRDKKPLSIVVEVGSFKDSEAAFDAPGENQKPPLGLEVQTLTPDLAASLGVEESKAVVIIKVAAGSPAAFTGLKKGALILAVNQQPVASKQEYEQILRAAPAGKPVLFLVKQGNQMRYVSIRVEP